jgi:NH3-dependent NAD+ synthetase
VSKKISVDEIPKRLQIDSPAVCEEITTLIRTTQEKLKRDGAAVAVSGGLDSAVAANLAVRASTYPSVIANPSTENTPNNLPMDLESI